MVSTSIALAHFFQVFGFGTFVCDWLRQWTNCRKIRSGNFLDPYGFACVYRGRIAAWMFSCIDHIFHYFLPLVLFVSTKCLLMHFKKCNQLENLCSVHGNVIGGTQNGVVANLLSANRNRCRHWPNTDSIWTKPQRFHRKIEVLSFVSIGFENQYDIKRKIIFSVVALEKSDER